jgi:hypothetical protein
MTLVSRRAFMRTGGALALLAAAPAAWARSAVGASNTGLTRARFTPLVGSTIGMTGAGDNLQVVLSEVADLLPVLRVDDPDRFALLFTATRGDPPTPGIRTFTHPELGEVALFVSPVDRGVNALHYEAVINRSTH